MNARRLSVIALSACLGLAALSGTAALAQQDPGQPTADDVDPPAGAGRLSYLAGAVSVQPAGVEEWTAAIINRPLTSGDQLWSDRGSRAEIELGAATVSVAQNSSVTLLNLSDEALQLQLSAGTINVALRELDAAMSFEIDAPNAAVSLVRPGSYRIDVDDAGDTTVAMRAGQAQVITSAGQSVNLRAGQGAVFGPNGNVDVAALGAADDFDRWCAQRGQRWAQNQDASQYVANDVVGAQDLNDYGDWSQEPDYGYVWYPTAMAVDWAPYSYGRWLWVAPWGWTWVDSAPWGYAPFHYGRWAYLHQRWGWVPAPARSRAVYAPALVAWMGGPGGAAAGAAGVAPGVGWLPLAPGEVYLPGYRVSARYLHDVNVSNTTIINNSTITSVYQNPALQNRYANQNAPRALTVVSQASFVSGQSVAGRIIAPPPQWQAASATPRPPAILPARQSVLGPAPQAPVRRPPGAIANRPVIARHAPPPPPASFARQMDAMRTNGGRALAPAALQQLRGPDGPHPNIVLAPARAPVTPAPPRPPPMPDRHVMPVTPVGGTAAGESAPQVAPAGATRTPPSPPSPPIDRRIIPERSPQFQPPVQARPPVQVQPPPPPPPPPPREIEPPPLPAPPLPAPPPSAKPTPQVQRPEIRKGEPN
jgi:hypothetical protein